MSYLALEINIGDSTNADWQEATLTDDTSISMEHISAIWDTESGGGAFSYEFKLPVEDNLNILGSSCELLGTNLYKQLYGKQFRLYGGGICIAYGVVKMDDTVEIKEEDEGYRYLTISLSSSSKEWEDIIEGVNARDVQISQFVYSTEPVDGQDPSHHPSLDTTCKHNVQIGYCIPLYAHVKGTVTGYGYSSSYAKWGDSVSGKINELFETDVRIPQVMIPTDRYTNTSMSYKDGAPYCNVTICYSSYLPFASSDITKWEKQNGYCIGQPNRVNSAPCFYVLYWMDLLFEQLKVSVTNNSLKKYEDLMRLAFFHTDCHYESIDIKPGEEGYGMTTEEYKTDERQMNLSLNPLQAAVKMNVINISDGVAWPVDRTYKSSTGEVIDAAKIEFRYGATDKVWIDGQEIGSEYENNTHEWKGITKMALRKAYATSDNFPNVEVKNVLAGLQHAFGARFLYNPNQRSMNIILIKDILTQSSIYELPCIIDKVTKSENHVTGFRLKYSATSDEDVNAITLEEELTGVKAGTEGADTTFSYNNYANLVPLNDTYCNGIIAGNEYNWMLQHVSAYDKSCYYNEETSDTFRIKIDGESDGGSTVNPSLFEVAQFVKAEWGDCSKSADNKDFIEEVSIEFKPIVENDINTAAERKSGVKEQILAQLVEGEIHSYNYPDGATNRSGRSIGDFTHAEVNYPMSTDIVIDSYASKSDAHEMDTDAKKNAGLKTISTKISFEMNALETWELSGEHPTSSNDTGFCLGIMRGSGSDARTIEFDSNYDSERGIKWDNLSGSHPQFTSDSVNKYGQLYDYNGNYEANTYIKTTVYYNEVSTYISKYFGSSHADLLSDKRKVYADKLSEAGWNIASQYDPYCLVTHGYKQDGVLKVCLLTPIRDNGQIISPSELDDYLQELESSGDFVNGDDSPSIGLRLLIGVYNSSIEASRYASLLEELGNIYYGRLNSAQVDIYTTTGSNNGVGYNPEDAVSLRLRVRKPNPGYDPTCSKIGYEYEDDGKTVVLLNGVRVPNEEYLPCTNESHARRGLADKFYDEYAYWVLNRKIANIKCEMELATLINIDMTKKYKIGEYEGFIKRISYTIDNTDGLGMVDIEFYYL